MTQVDLEEAKQPLIVISTQTFHCHLLRPYSELQAGDGPLVSALNLLQSVGLPARMGLLSHACELVVLQAGLLLQSWAERQERGAADELAQSMDAAPPLSHGCLLRYLHCAGVEGGQGCAGGAAPPLFPSQLAAVGNQLVQTCTLMMIGGYQLEDRVAPGSGFCTLRSANSGCTPSQMNHGGTQEWPGLDYKANRWDLDCTPR